VNEFIFGSKKLVLRSFLPFSERRDQDKRKRLLGLENKGRANLVVDTIEIAGIKLQPKGGLELRADLEGVAQAHVPLGIKLGLEGGVLVKSVLGTKLYHEEPVLGLPCCVGSNGDLIRD